MPGEDAASYRRFWVAFGAWLLVSSCAAGGFSTWQFASSLTKFGGLDYLPRVISLAVVRVFAPWSVCCAALLAWISWAHDRPLEVVRAGYQAVALRTAAVALPAYPVAASLAISTSFATTAGAYGVSWHTAWSAMLGTIHAADVGFGSITTLSLVAVLVILASSFIPRLSSADWGLSRKIVVAGGVFVVVFVIAKDFIPAAERAVRPLFWDL